MSRKENKDNFARAMAHKANLSLSKLENLTVVELLNKIESLESKLSVLNSLTQNFDELSNRLQNYENHKHNYEDDNGTTQSTKATEGVN